MSAFLSDRTLSERLKTPKEGCSIEHFIAVLLLTSENLMPYRFSEAHVFCQTCDSALNWGRDMPIYNRSGHSRTNRSNK